MKARDQLPGDAHEGAARSGGKPLAPSVRRTMESRLGHSFADVRVHSDGAAASQARTVGARAFAIGRDVVFGAGQFAAGTPKGQSLLAHELAHVVQQRGPADTDATRAEAEASQAGRAVASGRTFAPAARTGPQLALQEEGEGEAVERAEHAQATTMLKEERLSFTHDRVAATTALISREMAALVKLPEAERPAARTQIHGLERQLAGALSDNVALLTQRIADLQARAAGGEDVKGELAGARRELADNRADLETLKGVFSPAKGEAFEDTYKNKVKDLHCMGAAYAGLGALTSPEESAKVESEVARKKKRSAKRGGPNVDQFITVLNTANAHKLAGPKQTAKWSRKHKVWTPSLEDLVRSRVNKKVPGFYFFGLALAEAFHSVLIGVSTWDEPRTMWCDQGGCTIVNGGLDDFARGKLAGYVRRGILKYKDWDSYVWQVVPPAAASVIADPRRHAVNSDSLVYPRVISGAIVGVDDPNDPKQPLVIIFQYNPDSLSRTLQPQMGAEGGDKIEALRLKGAPVETIKVDIELDVADQLDRDDPTARDFGLYPVLSALEMLVYPRTQQVIMNTKLLALGTIEILPPVAPLTVFVWGPKRAVPVKLTEFSITEEAHDLKLNPIRAKVALGMRVLSYSDLPRSHQGYSLFLSHQVAKEEMARIGGSGSLADVGGGGLNLT